MARSALVLALAALLVLGAAAGDSSNKNSGSDKGAKAAANASGAKLRPASVCQATKEAAKSYSACSTFREELCLTVQSDSCAMCEFLQADDGCDLQDGLEVQTAIDTAVAEAEAYIFEEVFGNQVAGTATFSSANCATSGPVVIPDGATGSCTVVGATTVVTYTCPTGTIPTGVGCADGSFNVVDGSTPATILDKAQCVYPSNSVTGAIMTVTCIPSAAVDPAPDGKVMPGGKAFPNKFAEQVAAIKAGTAKAAGAKVAAPNAAAKKP